MLPYHRERYVDITSVTRSFGVQHKFELTLGAEADRRGWLQPPAGGGHAESPETKRRFKALLDVSGLGAEVAQLSAPEASEVDLLRVHGRQYLERFKGARRGSSPPSGPAATR